MISLVVYKNIHLIGVFMVMMALGGLILHRINEASQEHPWRKVISITHGVGLLLMLLGGFGMLARLQIPWPWPGWVLGKIIIWFVLGALIVVIRRQPYFAKSLWWLTIILGGLAGYFALNKPF